MFGGGYGGATTTVTSGQAGGWVGYAPYVDALYHGFDTALYRMLLECQSLGGDGVVGVRLEQRHLGQGNREFVALGTAVRAAGDQRPARLFSTTLERPGLRQARARRLDAGFGRRRDLGGDPPRRLGDEAARPAPGPTTPRSPATPSS